MISVQEAEALILAQLQLGPQELFQQSVLEARILREPLLADRPLPPFDRVAMDGIALCWESWQSGQRLFPVAGLHRAGEPAPQLADPQHCFEVMTGAVLPRGCDTVVRYEDLEPCPGGFRVLPELLLKRGQNVHAQGSDSAAGQELVAVGTRLLPPQWAIAASVGQMQPQVAALPTVALISTGDELVSLEQTPQAHQIRISNAIFAEAALQQSLLGQPRRFHLSDQQPELRQGLAAALAEYPLLILSGGVSMGRFDRVPETLRSLGVRQIFHQVAQRPGKPFWFGVGPQQQLVFGLPGNPVSTAVCLYRYVLPALRARLGLVTAPEWAQLTQPLHFSKSLTWFVPVRLRCSPQARLLATPVPVNGSGDFASLAVSDGFLELPAGTEEFQAEEVFPLWRWQC